MSDPNTHDPNNEPEHIRQLREKADRVGDLEASDAAKDREIEFLRAGVNTGTRFGQNVMQAHGDKEISQEAIAETVKSVREELGLPPEGGDGGKSGDGGKGGEGGEGEGGAPKPGEPGSPEHQLNQTQGKLTGGERPPGTQPTPKPKELVDLAADTYEEARKSGLAEDQAQEAAIGSIIRAGVEGNAQARYDDKAEAAFKERAAQFGHGQEIAGLPERSY